MICSTCKNSYDNLTEYLCPKCGSYEKNNLFLEIPVYLNFLTDLVNKTATLADDLNKNGIPTDDICSSKLIGFNILTLGVIFDLKDYDTDIRFEDSRIPKTLKKSNPNFNTDTLTRIIKNIDVRNRISYLVISLFQFENLFVHLAIKDGYKGEQTYSKVVNFVIDKSKLSNKREKIDSLILPSIVRNTLHSNGVYYGRKNKDREFPVKNIPFKFIHGKQNELTSWRELIFYFNNIIDIIDELFQERGLK